MSTRIYQAYYRDDQVANLDPEFTPYDNRVNPVANIYEHYIYHQTRNISQQDGVTLWGTFSWQWKNKLHGPTAQDVLDFIEHDPGYDVYIFNAYAEDEAVSFNVWEQGQWCHPYILHLGRRLLDLMGEDPKLVEQPMTKDSYLAANYFVGTAEFWDGLLEFLDRFVAAIPMLNEADTELLKTSAGYGPNGALDHTGFICERLISTYIVRSQCRVKSWGGSSELSAFKAAAVNANDKASLHKWNQIRPAKGPKLATQWIEKLY
jgi:hypothetical protein